MTQNINPMPVPSPNFLIPVGVAQALLVYLGKQPYEEVAGFVNVLSTMKQAEFPSKAPSDPGGATGNNGEQASSTTEEKAGKK